MGAHKAPVKIHRAEKYAFRGLNDDTKMFFLRNFGCAEKYAQVRRSVRKKKAVSV